MRRLLTAAALLALLTTQAGAVQDPAEMLKNPAQEARAEQIGSQIRCVVCQNESVEDSGADLARDMRAIIRERVVAGDTDQQVIAWLVARYGSFLLLKPPLSRVTLLLWGTPFLGLVIGGLAAWLGRRRLGAAPSPLSPAEETRLAELIQTK
jgi:cytochrome c-type biogenesis protein CcmH